MAYLGGSSALSGLIRHANKTLPKIEKEVQNAVWDNFDFLKVMGEMGGIEQGVTGDRYNWPLEMDRNGSVGARGYQTEIPQEMTDRHRFAEEEWAKYTGSFVIAEDLLDQNSGAEKLIDYFMGEVEGLRKSMQEKINSDALKGGGAGQAMYGLTSIIPETNSSGTLHGRNLATDTWFRNQSTASTCSTTDAFGPIVMKEVLDQAAIAGRGQGTNPFRLGVTDDATFNNMVYYMPAMGTQGFYSINNQSGPSKMTKDMQVTEPLVMLRGARIMWDHAAIADAMRFFDPGKSVKWLWLKNNFFRMSDQVPSQDTFSYTVKMGCICMLVNCNPYTTGVIYNFNS